MDLWTYGIYALSSDGPVSSVVKAGSASGLYWCMLFVVDYMDFVPYMSLTNGLSPQILDVKSLTDTQQLNNSVCQAALS